MSDVLVYIALIFGYTFIQYNNDLADRVESESRLKSLLKETELNMLKSQINPHFLFNALNSLSLLSVRDPKKAREMIIKLSDFLRYSLRFGKDDFTPLSEEIENMEKYLEIEKVRFGDKLIFDMETEKEVMRAKVPSMILQPLLENAIKHGVYESTGPIQIQLKVEKAEGFVAIGISNEYDPGSIPAKGTGLGLKNTAERLKLIYGTGDLLEYSGENNLFRVKLFIPENK
jgi:LytS/YehU family sensor histidine kinase